MVNNNFKGIDARFVKYPKEQREFSLDDIPKVSHIYSARLPGGVVLDEVNPESIAAFCKYSDGKNEVYFLKRDDFVGGKATLPGTNRTGGYIFSAYAVIGSKFELDESLEIDFTGNGVANVARVLYPTASHNIPSGKLTIKSSGYTATKSIVAPPIHSDLGFATGQIVEFSGYFTIDNSGGIEFSDTSTFYKNFEPYNDEDFIQFLEKIDENTIGVKISIGELPENIRLSISPSNIDVYCQPVFSDVSTEYMPESELFPALTPEIILQNNSEYPVLFRPRFLIWDKDETNGVITNIRVGHNEDVNFYHWYSFRVVFYFDRFASSDFYREI